MKKWLALFAVSFSISACGTDMLPENPKSLSAIAPYPQAEAGQARSVIYLPKLTDESQAKVELVIGRQGMVDCNIKRLSGKLERVELAGWGYPYYVVSEVSGPVSTLMACPDKQSKPGFIAMHNTLGLLNYNSNLPIVVYAPKDMSVSYRVWRVEDKKPIAAVIE